MAVSFGGAEPAENSAKARNLSVTSDYSRAKTRA